MDQEGAPQCNDLLLEPGSLVLGSRRDSAAGNVLIEGRGRKLARIGPAKGSDESAERGTECSKFESLPSGSGSNFQGRQSAMTISEFVEKRFVPEHVAMKLHSGQLHYRAILKHVLTPREVERAFKLDSKKSKIGLKARTDWPFLGPIPIGDVRTDDVQRLISAAVAEGYSTQTIAHIRNVVSAIFSHAMKSRCFTGDNPASRVFMPGMIHEETHALTLSQLKSVVQAMQSPEKEIMLIAILTGMNVTEICALRWKYVNLTEVERISEGERVPARTIAVRKQWYRGKLGSVKKRRNRNLPISSRLLPILLDIRRRVVFTGPEDFVFASRVGTPINESNLVARRLKPIGNELQMPWLSWRSFCSTHKALKSTFGKSFEQYVAVIIRSCSPNESGIHDKWHCRDQRRRLLMRA
jgi:integrase